MLPIAKPPARFRPSRRGVLMAAASVGGAFVLGFTLGRPTEAAAQANNTPSPFDGYLTIHSNGAVTVLSAHMEMGQGIYHGIGTLVAEELSVPIDWVAVEGGAGNPRLYGNIAWGGAIQGTGGSTGTPSSWERYRKAGATAREMLRMAASGRWRVPIERVSAENGALTGPDGRRASYGEMAEAAARLRPPSNVALKAPEHWTLIGKDDTVRVGPSASDVSSSGVGHRLYTIDLRVRDEMLTAVVAHPPRFGARLASFDAGAAKAVKDVVDVVPISRGVAVVARNSWAAIKGRDALRVTWNEDKAEKRGSAELVAEYRRIAQGDGTIAARRGDAAATLGRAARVIEAVYEFPYLAHAALEPLDAVVRRQGDMIEIWGGHQMPDLYQAVAAQIAGVTPDRVKLHVMATGGGFGRRAVTDADIIVEACETAKAIGWRAPIKLLWTREDDMAGGRYRPLYVHRVRAALGPDGKIAAWRQHIVGQAIMAGTPFEAFAVKDGVDATSVEGASDTPYEIPNLHVEVTNTRVGVPVLWWRSVGHTHTAYAVETMIDELATAAGQDPIAFRLAHLPAGARERGVLELARDRAGWGQALPAGRFRGVAVHKSFGSYVAMVAEVSVGQGGFKVEQVVATVDCGVPINPDVIRAQVEGGIGFGLGAAMHSELTLTEGVVDQRNFDGYRVLRIDEMPKVEVHIVPSTASPTGIGEPGVPPIGPAVANALAAATGKRIRVLPFAKEMA